MLIRGIKGSNDRAVALNQDLYARLASYATTVEDLLFPISYQRLDQIWQEYRPTSRGGGKHFHCLRHTFAIELYQKTRDILKVKRALGHRQISNTMVYLEVQYDASEVMKDGL